MKNFFFIFLLFLSSCSKPELNGKLIHDFDFLNNMTFEEFKIQLKHYGKNKSFPNIDS